MMFCRARLIVGMMAEQKRLWVQEEKKKEENNIESNLSTLSWMESPAELAAAKEAAKWATKIYHHPQSDTSSTVPASYDDHLSAMTVTGRKFRIVHASVGLTGYGCPPEMIKLALSVHPKQVQEMDEDGYLPIHIAAVASSHIIDQNKNDKDDNDDKESSSLLSEEERSFTSDDGSEFSNRKWERRAFDKVIRLLLQKYPLSIRIPHGKSGRLPLILAMEAKKRTWNDGIQVLLRSYPAALESKEWNPKIYPSIFSLLLHPSPPSDEEQEEVIETASPSKILQLRKRRQRMSSMTILYDLIRARPNFLHRIND